MSRHAKRTLATGEPEGLRSRVLRAGSWSMSGHVLGQVMRLGGTLIMARLLVPDMFGVMAIATMVMVMLIMLSDIGIMQNIVQSRRGDDPAFLDTAWVIQILRGFVLWGIALLFSAALYAANQHGLLPPNSVYASEELPLVIAANSFAAVIFGLQSTKWATAHRHFDQKRVVQIDLAGQALGLAIMIGLGIVTRSIWALVVGGLAAALTTTLLGHIWLVGHRNRLAWESDALQELINFGRWAFVSSIFTVLANNGDRLILGGLVGADVLGLYAIAALLVGAVDGALNKILSAISLPVLSEIARNEPSRLKEMYYRLRVPSDLVLLFMAGLIFATGQPVVDLLYDSRYEAAGGMVEILAFTLVAARYGVAYQIHVAVGMPRYMAFIQIARCTSLFVLLPALYHFAGMQGALWAVALHGLAMVPFVHLFNAKLGLNDFRREAAVLAALPLGYAGGWAILQLLR